jgi:beta-lactam-binding protein with PASTA domain
VKRLIALGALSLASFAALWGSGIAASAGVPNVTGQKYGDAQGTLSDAGFTPVVSTTVGDRLPWSQCVVTNAVERTVQPPANSSGSATNDVLVSLNCDAAVASATLPGNSAASPAGRAAKAAEAAQTQSAG